MDYLLQILQLLFSQTVKPVWPFKIISFFLVLFKIQFQMTTGGKGSNFAEILLGLHQNSGGGFTQSSEFQPMVYRSLCPVLGSPVQER